MKKNESHHLTIEKYATHAMSYDQSAQRTMPIRLKTIDLLELKNGDVVLDVGCGTGLSFPIILDKVGPAGKLIAVELSPEMCELAKKRIENNKWTNVILINSSLEEANLSYNFDAILFNYTHDVLQSEIALNNILKNTKTNARISISGMKLLPKILGLFNFYVVKLAQPYMNDTSALKEPWNKIFPHLKDVKFQSTSLGAGYIASALKK